MQSLVDKINEAWKKEEAEIELEHANVTQNGPNSSFTKQHCKEGIASQLKRMQNNQSYNKD